MESLYLLIPFSVLLVFVIALIFWRSLKGGQFDDLEGPGFRILMDDDLPRARTAADEEKKTERDGAAAGEPLRDLQDK
ncbi:MAG: cbb3-type cytochrome oxidase assembly protein CcoS [Zoogloeaceae bacterium]|jgi:cbb3-type cytochrome oxidase maturation protein|nr:cbb3-type cytochrome oxidase assembly protein CcoS [Zoogloeaceae bacterium]